MILFGEPLLLRAVPCTAREELSIRQQVLGAANYLAAIWREREPGAPPKPQGHWPSTVMEGPTPALPPLADRKAVALVRTTNLPSSIKGKAGAAP